MRIVVALGGNALLARGQTLSVENQRANVRIACDQLAPIAGAHELVISHGNGPQVGLLAMQAAAFSGAPPAPLDVLGAETQGMIGYLVEQELGNRLPFEKPLATLLTMIEVDPEDPAFATPSKPIGPFYSREAAEAITDEFGWAFAEYDGEYRRVVPSPRPRRIFQLNQIRWMLEKGAVVICAGGGGIPTMYEPDRQLVGIEAVIDKDFASGLLAHGLAADRFVMATDADGVYRGWGTGESRRIDRAHPDALFEIREEFPKGSMQPKVVAACEFTGASGKPSAIGALRHISGLIDGSAGTTVTVDVDGIEYAPVS
ncbi:MAG: carbamate kinase [Acidimicrobiia bacterium]|nr:carbamate kinase [Acidimicrobiia bacterium]